MTVSAPSPAPWCPCLPDAGAGAARRDAAASAAGPRPGRGPDRVAADGPAGSPAGGAAPRGSVSGRGAAPATGPIATAVTVGMFDGVHRGHRALLEAARTVAGRRGRVIAVTFSPSPARVLRPDRAPERLASDAMRARYLRDAGADEIVTLDPRGGLLSMSAAGFVAEVIAPLRPAWLVEGPDFRFGRGREAGLADLARLIEPLGARLLPVPSATAVLVDGFHVPISSSLIRRLLALGRVADAASLLGRPYAIEGPVERGDQRGRGIGYPTANVRWEGVLLPADGIYAGHALLPDGARRVAAISIGTKPTFDGTVRACEAYLPGWRGPLDHYGWTIRLEFHAHVRAQFRFDSVEALVAQIERDCARVEALERRE